MRSGLTDAEDQCVRLPPLRFERVLRFLKEVRDVNRGEGVGALDNEDVAHPEGRAPDENGLVGASEAEVELWYGDRRAFEHLLQRLATYPRVVVLSKGERSELAELAANLL